MSKRVLVTGAGGFIGRSACTALMQRGYEVHAVLSPSSMVSLDGTKIHRADLLNASAVDDLVAAAQASHLLHLAWITTPSYWTSLENLRWTASSLTLVDSFRRSGGKRVVVAGSCAEYDWSDGVCIEGVTPTIPSTLYGTAKNALRQVLDAYATQAGLSFAWGRVFFAYGPGEREMRLVPAVVRGLLARERVPTTDGEQARDFLHVDDVGDAFAAVVDSAVTSAVNIGSGQALRVKDLIACIAEQLRGGSLVDFGALPQRPGEPALLVADVSRLTSEVGWRPRVSLDTGVASTIAWWQSKAARP